MKQDSLCMLVSLMMVLMFMVFPCAAQDEPPGNNLKAGGVKSLEKRIKHLEEAVRRTPESDKWYDRIQISGVVEVEAAHSSTDFKDPAADVTSASDIDLATVELVFDAKIAAHVNGHVMFKYETDTDVFVDEGFITLAGTEAFPAYLIAGRQYIPFGNFDSHFVTDPLTLDLGETNEGAAVAGYRFGGDKYDLSVGAFNGKTGKVNSDSTTSNYVASFAATPLESFMLGMSYTSNLAASGGLNEQAQDLDGNGETDDLNSYVGGWSAFASISIMKFKLIGEYVGATDEFEAGELYDAADLNKRKPSAWNVELGYAINDAWEAAGRYEASSDGDAGGAEFLPESRYGGVVSWVFFENTNLALEYLRSEYKNDFQTDDVFTVQLAVEF